eukprot:COSAG02_NODE_23817_length_707_cov_0.990132_1_plen_108_part_10
MERTSERGTNNVLQSGAHEWLVICVEDSTRVRLRRCITSSLEGALRDVSITCIMTNTTFIHHWRAHYHYLHPVAKRAMLAHVAYYHSTHDVRPCPVSAPSRARRLIRG